MAKSVLSVEIRIVRGVETNIFQRISPNVGLRRGWRKHGFCCDYVVALHVNCLHNRSDCEEVIAPASQRLLGDSARSRVRTSPTFADFGGLRFFSRQLP